MAHRATTDRFCYVAFLLAIVARNCSAFIVPAASSASASNVPKIGTFVFERSSPCSQRLPSVLLRMTMTSDHNSSSMETDFPRFFGRPLRLFAGRETKESVGRSRLENVIQKYIAALNVRDVDLAMQYVSDDIDFEDTSRYNPIIGEGALRRYLFFSLGTLPANQIMIVDETSFSDRRTQEENLGCVLYHLENGGKVVNASQGCTMYTLNDDASLITKVFDVVEPPNPKPGDIGLKVLNAATNVIGAFTGGGDENGSNKNDDDDDAAGNDKEPNTNSVVEKYFRAWNSRNMDIATECFAPDCSYSDLQFPNPFSGKKAMNEHLTNVANTLPSTFSFVLDDVAVEEETENRAKVAQKVGVRWHVENSGRALPFARGCSLYTVNEAGLIQTGVDIPEPAVIKSGGAGLLMKWVAQSIVKEPVRLLPLTTWAVYMYVVFFSDGILPGVNALQLEQRTWEEVRDLSINFFLVAPLLNLPFSPVVHPMLEGIFNLLLAWAALFAGFLSDERRDKPNIIPMVPIVIGMQLLTSAFFLPYLATRTSEKKLEKNVVPNEDMGTFEATIAEWRPLGLVLGTVGAGSIVWAFLARPEFGTTGERYLSLIDLLSIDRVGSSFLVDLAIFAVFQGWLVNDDLKRRSLHHIDDIDKMGLLSKLAKFVPFFGMIAYMTLRPALQSRKDA